MIHDVSAMDVNARETTLTESLLTSPSLSDWELWACACHEVKQYGDDAGIHASLRCDALLAAGDLAGHRAWLAILNRIDDLTASHDGETSH